MDFKLQVEFRRRVIYIQQLVMSTVSPRQHQSEYLCRLCWLCLNNIFIREIIIMVDHYLMITNDVHQLIISAVWLGLFLMITVTTSTRNIRAASKEIKIRSETFSGLLIQVHLDLLYAIHKTYKISILHCYDALNELLCTILLPLLIKTGVSLLLMKIITWKDIEEDHYC